jgi:hypothetical protein
MAVMIVFPPLTPTPLWSAAPGSLVVYEKVFAFVTFIKDQGNAPILAIFGGDKSKFIFASGLPVHEQVVRVGGDIVIEPDFQRAGVELRRVSSTDTSTIFIRDREVYGMLDMGTKNDPVAHVFSLTSGEILIDSHGQMAACDAWRLGVRNKEGETRWLISVPDPLA